MPPPSGRGKPTSRKNKSPRGWRGLRREPASSNLPARELRARPPRRAVVLGSRTYFCHVRFLWRFAFKRFRRLCFDILRRRFFFRLPMDGKLAVTTRAAIR